MTTIDYLIVAILVISAGAGIVRGFLREVCSLVTWIVAFWASWRFGSLVEPHLGGLLVDPPFSTWAGRGIVFVLVLVLGAIVSWLLSFLVRPALIRAVDGFLGFLFGLARGLLVVGLVVVLGQAARLDGESWWKHSRLIPFATGVAKGLHALGGDRLEKGLSSVGL